MYTGNIARRYAVSLLQFSEGNGCCAEVYAEARKMEPHLGFQSDAARTFCSPLATESDKIAAVEHETGMPLSETMRSFLSLVIRHRRCTFLRYIIVSFCRLYRKSHSIRQIEVRSATPLPKNLLNDILDRTVGEHSRDEILQSTDTELIGGYVIRVEDMVLDCSVRNDLDTIREKMVSHTK